MGLKLKRSTDVATVLDYFNGFHDGFIKSISLQSRDFFRREGPGPTAISHQLTGVFDVTMNIAHYNYQSGTQPHDRVVRCFFERVQDFYLDLRQVKQHDWPIINVEIRSTQRLGAQQQSEPCFMLEFSWNTLKENQWSLRKAQLFTFSEADFSEE